MTTTISNEAYIAGSLLIDGTNVVPTIQGLVSTDDFQIDAYRAIFTSSLSLTNQGKTIDAVSIQNEAKRQGVNLPNSLLVELMSCTPTAANCADYARRVADDAQVRRVKQLANQIQADNHSSADELLSILQRETGCIRSRVLLKGLLSPSDTLHRFNNAVINAGISQDNFISSGFPRLDKILGGGFIRSGLYIVGARPAMGKTTFAINLADKIQGNCLFISLEMSPEQLTAKRVARLTGIPAAKLLSGNVSDDDWTRIAQANSALSEYGMYINGSFGLTVSQIQLLAQSVPKLKIVIIDYLGLISPTTRGGSTYEVVSAISRELKLMAISLNVPVICLCQLSRSVENRQCKRPMLSDLRDSGAIEQDADGVLFLFREDYYAAEGHAEHSPSLVKIDVAKNRHGTTGETEFNFWLPRSSFREVN